MRFHVYRTSQRDSVAKPDLKKKWDKKLYSDEYVYTDERSASAPDKIPYYRNKDPEWWYSEGDNHRVERGHIKRDFIKSAWFLDIDTLQELMQFYQDHGTCMIYGMDGSESEMTIQIVDDYL